MQRKVGACQQKHSLLCDPHKLANKVTIFVGSFKSHPFGEASALGAHVQIPILVNERNGDVTTVEPSPALLRGFPTR